MERTIRQLLFTVYNSVAVLYIQSCDFTFTSQGPFIWHWIPQMIKCPDMFIFFFWQFFPYFS